MTRNDDKTPGAVARLWRIVILFQCVEGIFPGIKVDGKSSFLLPINWIKGAALLCGYGRSPEVFEELRFSATLGAGFLRIAFKRHAGCAPVCR
jgi:hypothetical protein